MGKLTIEQRAARNAKRLNNKEKKRHPLFADQFATTPDEQKARLARIDATIGINIEADGERYRMKWEEGDKRRAELSQLITREQLAECDARWDRLFGPNGISPRTRGGYGHEYWLSHWWASAKQYAPEWAYEHCPNAQFHELEMYQRDGKCPTCYKPLEASERETVIQIELPLV